MTMNRNVDKISRDNRRARRRIERRGTCAPSSLAFATQGQLHASLGTHDHAATHVGMHRAIIIVGAGPIESTAKACAR
jgi:hypothetical protein